MISKSTIKNTGNESIEDFYDYITQLYYKGEKEMAFSLMFKANREQLFNYFLLLLHDNDKEVIIYLLENLKIQKWVG